MSYFYILPLKISSLDFHLSEIGKPKSLKYPTNFYIICTLPPPPRQLCIPLWLIFTFPDSFYSVTWSSCCYQVNPRCLHLKIFALAISLPQLLLNTHVVPWAASEAKLQERGSVRRQAQMGLDSLSLMEQQVHTRDVGVGSAAHPSRRKTGTASGGSSLSCVLVSCWEAFSLGDALVSHGDCCEACSASLQKELLVLVTL